MEPFRGPLRRTFSLLVIGVILAATLAFGVTGANADTIVVGGAVSSTSHVTITDQFELNNIDTRGLNGSKIIFLAPYYESNAVNGFQQTVTNFKVDSSPLPSTTSELLTDSFGNKYYRLEWFLNSYTGTKTVSVTTSFDVTSTGNPAPFAFNDPRPTGGTGPFLDSTALVQSNNADIAAMSATLVGGTTTQAEAVDRILNYVKTSIPTQGAGTPKDAVSSLHSSTGNCVNRANLAMALLRNAHIQARLVNGLVSDSPYTVNLNNGYGTFSWGKELHVWIEVYYPSEGTWVPYDPFLNKGFADHRHVKCGIAIDSDALNQATGGTIDTFKIENLNSGATGTIRSPVITFASSGDSGSYSYRKILGAPAGAYILGRDMVNAPLVTATPTATPNASVTPTPSANVTLTPTPNATANVTLTPTPNATATLSATATSAPSGNGPGTNLFYISAVIVDAKSGARISDATVIIDARPVAADSSGAHVVHVPAGNHTIQVSAPGYGNGTKEVTVEDKDVPIVFRMERTGAATPTGSGWALPVPGFEIVAALAGLLIVVLYRYGRS